MSRVLELAARGYDEWLKQPISSRSRGGAVQCGGDSGRTEWL